MGGLGGPRCSTELNAIVASIGFDAKSRSGRVDDAPSRGAVADWAGLPRAGPKNTFVSASARDMLDLELALLRRGLDERLAGSECCTCCRRTPLVGERVYIYESGTIACELCRARQSDVPQHDRIVHGPEFGHTMRITDQRTAA